MKRNRYLVLEVALLLAVFGQLHGQVRLISAVREAQFKYDSEKTYVELYTSVDPTLLIYSQSNVGVSQKRPFVANVLIRYNITNIETDSSVVYADTIPVATVDTASIKNSGNLVTINRMLFAPGKYSVKVYAGDVNNRGVSDTASYQLNVRPFSSNSLSLSDIELCSEIKPGSSEVDPYLKNTLHVVPNPKGLYGLGLPNISYYLEIYGLDNDSDRTHYDITWNLIDSYGNKIKGGRTDKIGSASNVVQVGQANISNVPTGKYDFSVTVNDLKKNKSATAAKSIFIYNPYVKAYQISDSSNLDIVSSPFYVMGEAALDEEFAAARYLATPQEAETYQKLKGVDAKRRFMISFWKREDQIAGPDGFNSRRQFLERLNYVNQKYRTAFKAGWLTDRGRVYLHYGKPDDIERHPSSSNTKPYEIWYYNSLQGGVNFVFIDLTGFNDYVLIHSTLQGEVYNPDWQKYVQAEH
ncbi:MAG: GWxTD domain-containing protein [Candidatus Kryptoniota bacterium]